MSSSCHGAVPASSASGVGGRDADGELDLDRVGVLELVEQDPLVPVVQARAHRAAVIGVADERAGEHEQVVERRAGPFGAALAAPSSVNAPERGGDARAARPGPPRPDGGRARRPPRGCSVEHRVLVGPALPLPERRRPKHRLGALAACSSRSSTSKSSAQPRGARRRTRPWHEPLEEQVLVVRAVVRVRTDGIDGGRARARGGRVTSGGSGGSSGTCSSTRSQFCSKVRASDRAARRCLHAGGEQQEHASARARDRRGARRGSQPAPLELDVGADLVEHLDARREPGLDRVLHEDPLGERVEGADRRPVELVDRLLTPARRRTSPLPPASSRMPRARVRMRSRSSAAAFSVKVMAAMDASSASPSRDELDHPADEGGRLARTRPRPRRTAWTTSSSRTRVAGPSASARRLGGAVLTLLPSSAVATRCEVAGQRRVVDLAHPTGGSSSVVPRPSGSQKSAVDAEVGSRGARAGARRRPPRCRRRSGRCSAHRRRGPRAVTS